MAEINLSNWIEMKDFIYSWNNRPDRSFSIDEKFLLNVLKKTQFMRIKGRLLVENSVNLDELLRPVIEKIVKSKEHAYKEKVQKNLLKNSLLEIVHILFARNDQTLTIKNLKLTLEGTDQTIDLKEALSQIFMFKHVKWNEQNPGIIDKELNNVSVQKIYGQLFEEYKFHNKIEDILDSFPNEDPKGKNYL